MLNEHLPAGLEKYSNSPVFTENTLPQALLKTHSTKAGVWGLAKVLAGSICYVPGNDIGEALLLQAGNWVVIRPQESHRVEICGPVNFQIEFFRQTQT